MKKVIIDTDTAFDDAVALVMAITNPEIKIEAITTVAGNVKLAQATQNALYTIAMCGVEMLVYPGIERPLIRELKTADHVHGKDGMSDIGLLLAGFTPSDTHGVVKIIELINQYPNEITLVCLGPLTNIATAIRLDPTLTKKVRECVIMGGVGQGRGNVTPVSEYNFWADPEAAKITFESGMPIKMVGWDISREYAVFDENEVKKLRKLNTPLAHYAVDIQKTLIEYAQQSSHLKGFDLPDPIAMAVAIDESVILESKKVFVEVLTNDDYSRGQTAIDFVGNTGKDFNAEVVLKADREKFLEMLYQSLSLNGIRKNK